MYIYIYIYMYVCIYIYILSYTYMYVSMYTHRSQNTFQKIGKRRDRLEVKLSWMSEMYIY